MGKQTPRLVVAALIVAALVILAWQNATPTLALRFLGWRSVTLPLGVWLVGAIALGVLTTLAIAALAHLGMPPAHRAGRRRWTVRPDSPPHPDAGRSNDGTTQQRNRGWNGRSPQDFFRREAAAGKPRRDNDWQSRDRSSPSPPRPPNNVVAAEDWNAWGQRNAPSRWADWADASGNAPEDEEMSRRQRRDRDQAEAAIHDLDKGWDDSAQETVYVAPGGSDIEDALDEIEDGWEDWDSPDNPLADSAYAKKYDGSERDSRRDAIYAPPDDTRGDDEVYDADYRVIVPPYRPLDEDANERDRPS